MRAMWSSKRTWLPFAAAALCFLATSFTGPVLTAVLVFAAFGCCLEGATLMWSKAGEIGEYRQ